jgi:hypothetical protein
VLKVGWLEKFEAGWLKNFQPAHVKFPAKPFYDRGSFQWLGAFLGPCKEITPYFIVVLFSFFCCDF